MPCGHIADITLATALTYDFGIYKSSTYTGTKIPTFEQFIILCYEVKSDWVDKDISGFTTDSLNIAEISEN